MKTYKTLIIILFVNCVIAGQAYKVVFAKPTIHPNSGFHIELLREHTSEKIIEPVLANTETKIQKKYLELFYSWDTKRDHKLTVIVHQLMDIDLLYVDKNNDNNLANDGEPIVFPLEQNSIILDVHAENDTNQTLKLKLYRKPELQDSLINLYYDSSGNMLSVYPLKKALETFYSGFTGKARTYYFDDRVTFRKGDLIICDSVYSVGLFDKSNNGCYSDNDDMFIIDLHKKGNYSLSMNQNAYSITDVFSIGNKNYKISKVNKYGDFAIVRETEEEVTHKYHIEFEKAALGIVRKGQLKTDIWNYQLVSLNGETVKLSDYKGKKLFLSFWGEWCKPCVNELKFINKAFEKYNTEMAFLGVMKVNNSDNAKKLILEKNVKWKNCYLSDMLAEVFNINSYPQNFIIDADGKSVVATRSVGEAFFSKYVK